MKRLFVVIPLFLLSFLFVFSSKSYAYDCFYAKDWGGPGINGWNAAARSLSVCFGGFSSPVDINNTVIQVQCLDNSNLEGGVCSGVTMDSTTVTGYTANSDANSNPPAGQYSNGTWYACRTFEGVNRAVGKLQVNFSYPDGTTCSTSPIITAPEDWDFLTEGMPWDKGTNNAMAEGSVYCADGVSINTALGCVDVSSPDKFVTVLLRIATGIGGGLALALILYGVFIVTTSAGSPDKLKAGSEIITSAVIGLVFILLSIFLINLIGINILGIPGLS